MHIVPLSVLVGRKVSLSTASGGLPHGSSVSATGCCAWRFCSRSGGGAYALGKKTSVSFGRKWWEAKHCING
jgi:hypothetical protein